MRTHAYTHPMVFYTLSLAKDTFKNIWGSFHTPYSTYRELLKQNLLQLLVIFLLIGTYFFFVSPLKLKTLHPLLLTLNTGRLFSIAVFSYVTICLVLYGLGKIFKGRPTMSGIALMWGYSLIPTLMWFFATSLAYLVLPPPRHDTLLGKAFSLLFITFSVSLFFWKGILYYLTLRFGLQLDLKRILGVSLVFFPLLFGYAYILYQLKIFKVPFV